MFKFIQDLLKSPKLSKLKPLNDGVGAELGRIELVPHDPRWVDVFECDKEMLLRRFWTKRNGLQIHHVGSTAIPTVSEAKPVMDYLITAKDQWLMSTLNWMSCIIEEDGFWQEGDSYSPTNIGFDYMLQPVFMDKSCREFRNLLHFDKTKDGAVAREMLNFKKYLTEHPEKAQEYVELKKRLMCKFPRDIQQYSNNKKDFVDSVALSANRLYGRDNCK